MGAVQKLATTVIVGLVGLATLLVVYLANEPNRRSSEAVEQEDVAIERGIQTYIQNCVICHGPAGEGYTEPGVEGTGRIGMALGGGTEQGLAATENNQNLDAIAHGARYNVIVNTLQNGRGLMPAFGRGAEGGAILNDEQIYELATMIQNVNWNRVYNETIAELGGYPTPAPPPAAPGGSQAPQAASAGGDQSGGGGETGQYTIVSRDIAFEPTELTIPANQDVVVHLPNEGASPHNFSIDALDISVDLAPGETDAETTINTDPGDYEYYCNIPGHKEAGMDGTLTVSADAAPAAAGGAAPAAAPAGASPSAGDAGAASSAQAFTITSHDIYFDPKQLTVPANQDVVLHLPNEGASPHNFSIDALDISIDQAPGETDIETTINAAPADYEYYCNIPGHKEAGMVGTLTAAEGAAPPAGGETAAAQVAPAGEQAAGTAAAADAASAETYTVTSHDIYFDPKQLTIPANQDVVVHLPNEGAAAHNFSIDALNISVDLAPGETDAETTINAAPGDYEYYCDIPGHKEAGMVGTLTAE